MRALLLLLPFGLLGGGCDGEGARGALDDGFAAELTEQEGCADVALYAYNADGTILLSFYHEGLVRGAYEAGESEASAAWSLPDAAVSLEVESGRNLDSIPCNDAITDEIERYRTYTPTSGSATLSVLTTGEGSEYGNIPADATLILEDVELEDAESGDAISLPFLTITSDVGWFPG